MTHPIWHNKITRYAEEAPDQLLANPRNWRIHSAQQQQALAGVLDEIGWIAPIILNEVTQHVIDGHLRISMALRQQLPTVPVIYVQLTEAEEAEALATFDPLSAMAATDAAQLDALLREVSTSNDAVQQMLANLAEQAGVVPLLPEAGAGGDDFAATPDDGPPRVQLGDIFALGDHRLICGDCTDLDVVHALMGDMCASVCFTSPPYNAGASEKLTGNTHTANTKYVAGDDDDMSSTAYLSLLSGFTSAALTCCDYVFVNVQSVAGNKVALIEYQYAYRDHFADVAIWDKTHAQPAMAPRVMNSQFEYIFMLSAAKTPSCAIGSVDFRGTVANVYRAPPQRNNAFADVHAATFPLHLPTWIIETFTRRGEVIYEPFAGTGTTMIAGERLGRKVYQCQTPTAKARGLAPGAETPTP